MEHVQLTLIQQVLKGRVQMILEGSVLPWVDNQLNLIIVIFIHLFIHSSGASKRYTVCLRHQECSYKQNKLLAL